MIEALQSIKNQKLKFFLSGLGITWGIFITTLLLGVGNATDGTAKKTLDIFNNVILWVVAGATSEAYEGTPAGQSIQFKKEDIEILKQNIPDIHYISPHDGQNVIVKSEKNRDLNVEIRGVTNDFFLIKHFKIAKGRLLNPLDHERSRNVCLLSEELANSLYPNETNCVGKSLLMGRDTYMIVGVFKSPILDSGDGRAIFIPDNTFRKYYNPKGNHSVLLLDLQANATIDVKTLETKIRTILSLKYHFKPSDYKTLQVYDTSGAKKTFDGFFLGLKGFIWFVGLCTLFSGVMGIANIMYVTAKERTREIGIRKAIGASRWAIMRLFLIESLLVTISAGIFGILIGYGVLLLIGFGIQQSGFDFVMPYVTVQTLVAYIIILLLSGILSGLIPAYNAAKINTVEALRYE